MGRSSCPPRVWLPVMSATWSVDTLPSLSFQLSLRTVNSFSPVLDFRYVSVMLAPQHERLPPTVPRETSSQLTVLQLYPARAPPWALHAALIAVIV